MRCFASLFYTYRRFLLPTSGSEKKSGMIYRFNMTGFLRSIPQESSEYLEMLQNTQGQFCRMNPRIND